MIESFGCSDSEYSSEEILVDTLKEDLILIATMVSGARHEISLKQQISYFFPGDEKTITIKELEQAILHHWIAIQNEAAQ